MLIKLLRYYIKRSQPKGYVMKKFPSFSKTLLLSITSLGLTTSPAVYADGSGTSGGGRAIVCFSSKAIADRVLSPKNPRQGIVTESEIPYVTNVETLDYYWAKQANAKVGNISYPPSDDDFALVEAVKKRVELGLPELAKKLSYFSANHPDRDQIVKLPNGLNQLDDAAEAFVPDERCVVTTVARQSKQGDGILLEIDERLFSRMKSDYSKKVLMLHETLYSWARNGGAQSSDGVRAILARLISKQPITRQLLAILAGNSMRSDSTLYSGIFDGLFSKMIKEVSENIVGKAAETANMQTLPSLGFSASATSSMRAGLSQESFYKYLGGQAGGIDALLGAKLKAAEASAVVQKQYDACKNHSCRKALEATLAQTRNEAVFAAKAWNQVIDYFSIISFDRNSWNLLQADKRGSLLNWACTGTNSSRPAVFVNVCQAVQQDVNAFKDFDSHAYRVKFDEVFSRETESLFQDSKTTGILSELLNDLELNRVPYNRNLLEEKMFGDVEKAISFTHDGTNFQNEFIIP